MIVLRIAGGIREHFGVRFPEWIMTVPLAGWAAVLLFDPATFGSGRSFAVIARYGDEATWGNLCLFAAFLRLAALVVNGTFRAFRFAPHLRAAASVVAALFWGHITLGVLVAALTYGSAATGVIAYGTFVLVELWNLFRARADVGAQRKAG